MPKPMPFVWYELMTSDTDAAKSFYGGVVGWTTKDMPIDGKTYTILEAGGAGVAGLMGTPPDAAAAGAKPGWSGYIGVDDVDAMAARIVGAGGSICMPPADIPTVGRFAVMADPMGATFMLFTPLPHEGDMQPPPPNMSPGTIGWREHYTDDLDAAWNFYASMFGWSKADAMDMGDMGIYQLFRTGPGDADGGMMKRAPGTPGPLWQYYFCVDAIDAAVARVKAGGGQVLHGPQEVPGGMWIILGVDPQGASFALVGPRH